MAKIKLGFGIAAIAGKVGGGVFSVNKGGTYVRTWAKPTNPNTPLQAAARSSLSSLSSFWRSLTNPERESWKTSAAVRPVTNTFGEVKYLSGFQLFMKQNLAGKILGIDTLTAAPAATPSKAYTIVDATLDYLNGNFVANLQLSADFGAGPGLNDYFVLSFSQPTSPSQKIVTSRQLVALNSADPSVTVVGDDVEISFKIEDVIDLIGPVPEGYNVQLQVMYQDANDPWDTVKQTYTVDSVPAA